MGAWRMLKFKQKLKFWFYRPVVSRLSNGWVSV